MARCEECLHYDICAKEGRLVQIDEHTWDNYNQLDDVERFCVNHLAADVAPKSEVELYMRLYHEVEDELASTYDKLDKAKAEVAREIFEEIEKLVALKMPAKITPIFKRDLDYSHGVIDGQRDAVFGILVLLTELKKKYTEDNG